MEWVAVKNVKDNGGGKMLFPFYTISVNSTGCFLMFYLFITFLDKLIHALNENRIIPGIKEGRRSMARTVGGKR